MHGRQRLAGRSDDLINLRGIKMFPVQIEEAVRALAGDEFEIVLSTGDSGLAIMTVRANMAIAPATAAFWRGSLKSEIRRAAKVAYRSNSCIRHTSKDRV